MQCLAPQLTSNAGVVTWGKEERMISKGESGAKDGRCQRGNKGVRRKKKANRQTVRRTNTGEQNRLLCMMEVAADN